MKIWKEDTHISIALCDWGCEEVRGVTSEVGQRVELKLWRRASELIWTNPN